MIHSFWVPAAGGKQDVVPARTNHILLEADEPGTYFGQCAEFCGLQHGKMKFRVVALVPARTGDAWVANQKTACRRSAGRARPAGGGPVREPAVGSGGQCVACHAIGGVNAGVDAGPNLTHFAAETHSVLRRMRLEHERHRGAEGVAPRSERREAGGEDAQLPPDRRRDQRARRLPAESDVRGSTTMASVTLPGEPGEGCPLVRRR